MEQVLRELSLRRRLAVREGGEGGGSCTAEGEQAVHRGRGGRGPGGVVKEWRKQQIADILQILNRP